MPVSRNSPSLTVKCQLSLVPCPMYLSSDPLSGCPADQFPSVPYAPGSHNRVDMYRSPISLRMVTIVPFPMRFAVS